jgi:hypothetical protein
MGLGRRVRARHDGALVSWAGGSAARAGPWAVSPRLAGSVCLAALLSVGGLTGAGEADRPEILSVAVHGRLAVARPAALRVAYRAPRANVVAVIQVVEDLDGLLRTSRQRELGVAAAALGQEAGELLVPLDFGTPGRKRVVLTLVTDGREESEPARVELEVAP